jgi:lysyl-tRNA synthetase class 2
VAESEILKNRREKAESLKEAGIELYPNDARIAHTTGELVRRFGNADQETLQGLQESFTVAGRIMAVRDFGKAAFIQIQDRQDRIQAYIRKDKVGEESFQLFRRLDIGDIVMLEGRLFRTRTNELTIEAGSLRLLSKSMRPLPEKWHGLTDTEARYRMRYLDLIANPHVRRTFHLRNRIIQIIRRFMQDRDFLEVETPMMQALPGGAAARPFRTYHNALGMDLYLRIAPELYLKRLVVGGLERVFEINRNFRNEGISTLHNPEFTMMEFYQAYATFEDLMAFTEELIVHILRELFGSLKIKYQGTELDFTPPWPRLTVRGALLQYGGVDSAVLDDRAKAAEVARSLGAEPGKDDPLGKIIMEIFDRTVEDKLIQPVFITAYPVEVSPLSRKNSRNPAVTDRFELYIHGREIANAFSELNDPDEQRERFLMQIRQRESGDEEAHLMDEDFVRALEYGMPPTAGEGIGIDRLVMILTDSASIRDVILFPLLRTKEGATEEEEQEKS